MMQRSPSLSVGTMDTSKVVEVVNNVGHFLFHTTFGRVVVAVSISAVALKNVVKYKKNKKRKAWIETSKKTVILHQGLKSFNAPSPSPFCLKLETYLRMANIEYQNDMTVPMGPKGKTPWVTVDGKEIGDSEFVMRYFRSTRNKDFTKNLDQRQVAVAMACQLMMENHAFWGMLCHRYYESNLADIMPMSWQIHLILKMYRRIYKRSLNSHGFGRHSPEEMHMLVVKDLQTVSTILGDKPFFAGDEPCEIDCSMFGFLAQLYFNGDDSDYERAVKVDYPNLADYVLRMKARFWPDWEKFCEPRK